MCREVLAREHVSHQSIGRGVHRVEVVPVDRRRHDPPSCAGPPRADARAGRPTPRPTWVPGWKPANISAPLPLRRRRRVWEEFALPIVLTRKFVSLPVVLRVQSGRLFFPFSATGSFYAPVRQLLGR